MDNELNMELPKGWKQGVKRMLYGANHTLEEIKECKIRLDKLYKKYNKNKGKLKLIDEYWDTMNVESHFKEPIWYNAHKRRARYIKNMDDARRDMFYMLTNFDGNGSEEYCKYNSISADDIMYSFDKYFKRNNIDTKICTMCIKRKPFKEFHKYSKTKDGHRPNCKLCHLKKQKEYRLKYPWRRTLEIIKQRCENPNNNRYKYYGLKGIKCLITENELKELWFRDKAYDMKLPTIDRKDNKLNYILDNCEFIEKSLNSQKDKFKPILQFDLDENFIKEWESIGEASKILKISTGNIRSCFLGNKYNNHVNGFLWKFK